MRRVVHFLARLFIHLVVSATLLLAVALWQFSRELPAPLCRWLETRLSRGPVSVMFDQASFNLLQGIRLRDVQVHPRRSLGNPLFRADGIRLSGGIRRHRPPAEWIDAIAFDGLVIDPFLDWPVAPGGWSLRKWAELFDPSQPSGALFSRPVTISIDDSTIFGIETERVGFKLRSQKNRLFIDEARVDIVTANFRERVDGEATYDFATRRLHASATGSLTPDAIEAFCLFLGGEHVVRVFHDFSSHAAPFGVNGSLLLESPAEQGGPVNCDLRLAARGSGGRFRGQPYRSLQFALQWLKRDHERKLTLAPVVVDGETGRAEIALAYYPAREVTDFTFQSNLPAQTLLKVVDGEQRSVATNLTFNTSPDLTLSGTIAGVGADRESRVQGRLLCDDVVYRNLHLHHVNAEFTLHGTNRLVVPRVVANCYGGSISGHVSVVMSPLAWPPRVNMELAVRDVDVIALRADQGVDSKMGGLLSGDLRLAFPVRPEALGELNGAGRFSIRKGAILRVPLFAGLTDFLGRNVPGVDALLMQSDASLPFSVTNGLVTIRDFRVEGNLFSLTANGHCRLAEPGYPIEGVTQLRFFKQKTLIGMLARLVTLPVSKMMEFRLSGPVTDPKWNYIGLIDRIMDTLRGDPASRMADDGDEAEAASP